MNDNSKILPVILAKTVMRPNDITYALKLVESSTQDIADVCDTSASTVSSVIHGNRRSFEVANLIASKLNTTVEHLWGDAYDYTPRKPRKESSDA